MGFNVLNFNELLTNGLTLLYNCAEQSKINTFYLIGLIIYILKIAVPIILMVVGSIDLIKAITSQDNNALKSAATLLAKKAIIAVIIFLIPSIVILFSSITGFEDDWGDLGECVLKPTKCSADFEYIQNPEVCDENQGSASNKGPNGNQMVTVSLKYEGGKDDSGSSSSSKRYESYIETPSFPSVTKSGYDLIGWKNDSGYTYLLNSTDIKNIMLTRNIIFYAVWESKITTDSYEIPVKISDCKELGNFTAKITVGNSTTITSTSCDSNGFLLFGTAQVKVSGLEGKVKDVEEAKELVTKAYILVELNPSKYDTISGGYWTEYEEPQEEGIYPSEEEFVSQYIPVRRIKEFQTSSLIKNTPSGLKIVPVITNLIIEYLEK